jgi:hypothetical protein
MRPPTLAALLLITACHARLDGAPSDAAAPDHGAVMIDLLGDWSFSYDGVPSSYPLAVVTAKTAASITVAYTAPAGRDCGCSAQHVVVVLPRQISCDTTMSFDWAHNGPLDDANSTALRVDFDPGANADSGNAGQFVGSTWHGPSGCAWRADFMGRFPAETVMVDGHNDVALGQLVTDRDGECRSAFDVIDVHVEGYNCNGGEMSATLANLVLR